VTVLTTSSSIDERLAQYLIAKFDDDTVRRMSQHFRREGYVKIPGLVPQDLFDEVSVEVNRILDLHERRIDLKIKVTGESPRYMSTVNHASISSTSDLVPAIYDSAELKGFLSRIAREDVVECPYEEERFICTRLHKKGDTHGWHWGDFSFTLIWIIEAPEAKYGGQLQCVPHTDWNKDDPRVEEYLINHPIRTYGHVTGDIYFLRSDTTLHRTVPLNEDKTRIILNTCWASLSDTRKPSTHETMQAMF
jgi:hypothetical protein